MVIHTWVFDGLFFKWTKGAYHFKKNIYGKDKIQNFKQKFGFWKTWICQNEFCLWDILISQKIFLKLRQHFKIQHDNT